MLGGPEQAEGSPLSILQDQGIRFLTPRENLNSPACNRGLRVPRQGKRLHYRGSHLVNNVMLPQPTECLNLCP